MSLATDIQRAVKAGVGALSGIKETVTYKVAADPTYNTTTGAPSTSLSNVTVDHAVFAGYRREEIDGEVVRPEDQKCLLPASGFSVTPTLNDLIVRANGEEWSVIGITRDPAGALWILQVRRP